MKVKLLKKVRKRFSILYNENGHYSSYSYYPYKFMLKDKKHNFLVVFYENKNDCINSILSDLRKEYKHLGKNGRSKKIWYKNLKLKLWSIH